MGIHRVVGRGWRGSRSFNSLPWCHFISQRVTFHILLLAEIFASLKSRTVVGDLFREHVFYSLLLLFAEILCKLTLLFGMEINTMESECLKSKHEPGDRRLIVFWKRKCAMVFVTSFRKIFRVSEKPDFKIEAIFRGQQHNSNLVFRKWRHTVIIHIEIRFEILSRYVARIKMTFFYVIL